jgi:hypothetical protein
MTTNSLFLQELKEQYEKLFEITDALEGKANNLLTVAGLVATLLFGFGSFIVDKFDATYNMLTPVTILLMIGIVGNVISIFWSVMVFRIKDYLIAMDSKHFYDQNGNINEQKVEEYRDEQDENVFTDTLIDTYLKCNRHNGLRNDEKAVKIKYAFWSFLGSIVTAPITIGILLTQLPN